MKAIKKDMIVNPQVIPAVLTRDQLLTVGDFDEMRIELVSEIRQLVKQVAGKPTKQWLKSIEVRKLLGISPNTLQHLRDNGQIPFSKVGGVVLYSTAEILQLFESRKH